MNEELRKFKDRDLEEIVELVHRTTRESYRSFYPKEAIDYFIDYHSPQNIKEDAGNGTAVVLLMHDRIIGTGTLLGTNIRRVFVLPEFQGHGFGKKIMDYLETEAIRSDVAFLDLHSSLPAKRFYDSGNYKTLKFCSIPVDNNLTLDYYRMAKMLKPLSNPPAFNLNNRIFHVLQNDGPGAEVNGDTIFAFYQCQEMVMGEYKGGKIKEGDIIGYIEGEKFHFHYEQINLNGEKNSGNSNDKIEVGDGGKIKLIDTWKWETKEGEGHCIMQEK